MEDLFMLLSRATIGVIINIGNCSTKSFYSLKQLFN